MTDSLEGNVPVDYEDEAYVVGVRDLSAMIERDKTANWKAVAGVLNDCANLIEARTLQRDTSQAQIAAMREALEGARLKLLYIHEVTDDHHCGNEARLKANELERVLSTLGSLS